MREYTIFFKKMIISQKSITTFFLGVDKLIECEV